MTHRPVQYMHAASGLLFVATMIAGWFFVAASSVWMLRELRDAPAGEAA
ncbi:hypothetical protein ACIBI3_20925 [Actinomadura luteofluorescens]